MSMKMGEKIQALRKGKHISQETLAEYLGVSFQAVSKWENSVSMPDVTLIPAIAEFFGTSTDELFDFNALETEKRVMDFCHRSQELRHSDPAAAEAVLREGLRRYPGNEIILNNLLYTIRTPERRGEVIDLCRTLTEERVRDMEVRCDAWRIMAETYQEMGEYGLAKDAVEHIPEIYFTKLEVAAELLEGEEAESAARRQRSLSADLLLRMLLRLTEHYAAQGDMPAASENFTAAKGVLAVMGSFHAPFEDSDATLAERFQKDVEALEEKL